MGDSCLTKQKQSVLFALVDLSVGRFQHYVNCCSIIQLLINILLIFWGFLILLDVLSCFIVQDLSKFLIPLELCASIEICCLHLSLPNAILDKNTFFVFWFYCVLWKALNDLSLTVKYEQTVSTRLINPNKSWTLPINEWF